LDLLKTKEPPAPTRAMDAAWRLASAVRDRYALAPQHKPSAWAKEFDALASELRSGGEARPWNRLGSVLNWYTENMGTSPYLPDARCGKAFRAKFIQIENAMKREALRAETDLTAPSQAPLDPVCQEILQELQNLHWPGDSEQQLAGAIVSSVKNWNAFVDALPNLKVTGGAEFLRERLDKDCRHAGFEIPKWFRERHAKVAGWKEWSGDMKPLIWTANHPEFGKRAHVLVRSWTNLPMDLKDLKDLLAALNTKERSR